MDGVAGKALWWQRQSLAYQDHRLQFCGRDVATLAEAFPEPIYLYDAQRVIHNLERVHAALDGSGVRHRLYYAMKANRFRPILCRIRESGLCGIDVCSPEELCEAFSCGFQPQQISYTAQGFTRREVELLSAFPDVIVNCDCVRAIHQLGSAQPGRDIGIRVNPSQGYGYGDSALLNFSGPGTSKFGIYQEHFEEAMEAARSHRMRVRYLHAHQGCGYLDAQLGAFTAMLQAYDRLIERAPDVVLANVGGGLGVPHTASDRPLDLARWGALIAEHLSRPGVEVAVEPGDFIAKDAGILITRVNYVERKRDKVFVGVNSGFNLAPEPVFYRLPCEPVPCVLRDGPPSRVTIAGNMNEPQDIWASDVELPPVREGDCLALLNAGGYAAAMGSRHCLRDACREFLLLQ
jgi:diaminopimelate decarboxylase